MGSQYLVAWSKKLFAHVLFHIIWRVSYIWKQMWLQLIQVAYIKLGNAYRIYPTTKLKSLPSIATVCKFGYYSHLIKKQPTSWLYTAVIL